VDIFSKAMEDEKFRKLYLGDYSDYASQSEATSPCVANWYSGLATIKEGGYPLQAVGFDEGKMGSGGLRFTDCG